MTTRFYLRLGGATLLSLGFLYLAFRDIDGHALWAALKGVKLAWVAVYLLALSATQVTRAARWGMLVQPFAPLDGRAIWRVSNVGNMLIMLLPLRLGELSRPYMMRRLCGASMSAGMGAAVVERALDGLLVTLLFFAVTWAQRSTAQISETLQTGAKLALLIFVSTVVLLIAAVRMGPKLFALIEHTVGRISGGAAERIVHMLRAFIVGLGAVPDGRTLLGMIGWTLAYWIANALGLDALLAAFGCDLPPIAGFTVVCVLVIGVMIPAGPGLLGTYQAAIMAGLSIYHIDKNVSAALSVVAYLGNLGVIVAFGLPYVVSAKSLALKDYAEAQSAQ
jgi:uncharacterized protein (TIRG00374 family)